MYHAALRVSEVARSNSDQHVILYNCITFNRDAPKLTIKFRSYKHSNNEKPTLSYQMWKKNVFFY